MLEIATLISLVITTTYKFGTLSALPTINYNPEVTMDMTIDFVPAHYNVNAACTIPAAWVARVWDGERITCQGRAITRAEVMRLMREQYPDAVEV